MIYCKDCRHLDGRKCHNPKFGHYDYDYDYDYDPVTAEKSWVPNKDTYESAEILRNEHGKCYLGVEFQPKFTFKEKFMARLNWWMGRNFDEGALK